MHRLLRLVPELFRKGDFKLGKHLTLTDKACIVGRYDSGGSGSSSSYHRQYVQPDREWNGRLGECKRVQIPCFLGGDSGSSTDVRTHVEGTPVLVF
mgnify:CR=1 FL=1